MYLIILFLIAYAIVLFSLRKNDNLKRHSIIGVTVIFIIVYLITYCIGSITVHNINSYRQYEDINIVSLGQKNEEGISGSFFLGIGSISSYDNDYYVVYGQFKDGLKRITVNRYGSQDVFIKETNTEFPKIKNYFYRIVTKPYHNNWFGSNNEIQYSKRYVNRSRKLILIVPKNTIYRHFDLKD